MSAHEGDPWATLCGNLHALLTATPARLDVVQLCELGDVLGVPLPRLLAHDFDVSEVPWLPALEVVRDGLRQITTD